MPPGYEIVRDDPDPAWAERWFVPAALLILVAAAALRLPELALNPFHHDEGVNGFFTTNLVRNGVYQYDPANYHGPTLYYFAFVSSVLVGLTSEALRLVPVFFGLLTVALVLPLRRLIGPIAALGAAALLAVSPGAVYMSRYFIHEALLVCFSLGLVASALLYLDRRELRYLVTGAAAAALMFATKETGVITVAVLVIAAVVTRLYVDFRTPEGERSAAVPGTARGAVRPKRKPRTIWIDGVEYRATSDDDAATGRSWPRDIDRDHLAVAAVVFAWIYVLFFSSFFTNFPKGLIDSLATFTVWTHTSGATQSQPVESYVRWMLLADGPILVLGAIGGLIAALHGRDRLWVFVGLWALGITLAYSLISYKTPWIALNMLLPLALLAGLAIRQAWARVRWRPLVALVVGGALALSGYQAVDLNYRHYDDETYPYVFVHTTRDALVLLDEIEAIAERAGTGRETGVVIMSPDHWPLPWYLRDYTRAGYYGQIVDTEEAMIVGNVNQAEEIGPKFGDRYRLHGTYTLRPGVRLELYVRSDIELGPS